MMWLLVKLNDGTTKYLVSENKSYTVGRKNSDITVEDDASVSRKHCTFYVTKQSDNSTRVWVLDEQSKYGTFLKNDNVWVQLNANERKNLTSGSVIKFGLLENSWRLEYKPIIACASGVPVEQKKNLETILKSIDGYLKSAWCKDCSLVIVNEITLTVKVVLALINGIPIVRPVYLEKVAEAVKNQTEVPNYEDYQPVIKENILDKSLVSLDIKNHRKELFKGKKFVIPTQKQLETLKDVIMCAGGTVELLPSTHGWENFGDNNVVVIQLPFNNSGIPEELIKLFKELTSFLKMNYGKRVVPESEIAQAVAYSSTEKFCNPKSTCFNLRFGERKQLDLEPLLAEETARASEEVSLSQRGVVFASATFDWQTLQHRNAELHPSTDKRTEELQCPSSSDMTLNAQREHQKPLSQRKRTHKLDLVDQETPNKRVRNSGNSKDENRVLKEASAENKDVQEKSVETAGNSNRNKTSDAASSCTTNNLPKPNELPSKEILEHVVIVARQSSREFWDFEPTHKRKTSDSQNSVDDLSRKKAKLLQPTHSKQRTPEINACKNRTEVLQRNCKSSFPPPPPRIQEVEEEIDFTDFFGKETSDADALLYDLNNTILSLTIIPRSFLKEDGSLIEPPEVPVNVKKFRKQKISAPALNPLEDDELSDGEWIEPHSDRLNISVLDGDEY